MSGLEIFLAGGILLCNAVLVGSVVLERKRKPLSQGKEIIPDSAGAMTDPEKSAQAENKSGVGRSNFDIDRLEARMLKVLEDTVKDTLPVLVGSMLGDVRLQDVEFADDKTDAQDSDEYKPHFTPLSSDETELAFGTDIRDVDDMYPSAPMATGTSIEELEDAVNTAVNPNSTTEQQVKAGKLLAEIKDTELFDRIASVNDDIDRRVNLCIRMRIKADIEANNNTPTPPKTVRKSMSVKITTDDPDNFNPADMLP